MYSKVSKGTVVVGADKGSLRLQIPSTITSTGKQAYVTLGLKDTPQNREVAHGYALQIQAEILQNRFDSTLERYKAFKTNHRNLAVVKPSNNVTIAYTLDKLWTDWCEFKKGKVAETTYLRKYEGTWKRAIEPFESLPLTSDIGIKIESKIKLNPEDKKRVLSELEQACNQAIDYDKYKGKNPFRNLSKAVTFKRERNLYVDMPLTEEMKAFSITERDLIIEAYKSSRFEARRNAANFVRFCFWTGCRPGEAVELRWGDVKQECSKIIFRRSYDEAFKVVKDTKTGEIRAFNANPELQEFLQSIKPVNASDSDLVLVNKKGKRHSTNLIYSSWVGKDHKGHFTHGVVSKLVEEGLIKQVLSPYHMRHTFVSIAIEAGVPVEVVAAQVGHSVEVSRNHYVDRRQAALYVIPQIQ